MSAAAAALPASARDQNEPVATREPDAQDVAMTPLKDLNLSRDEVPAVLLAAATDPYASAGLDDCPAIGAAIADLDRALGPDMDVALAERDRISTGRMAKSVVASFIPFRGILREISGAAEQERAMRSAVYSGAVRRGFLKGLGQQRGCAYPARPAFARIAMARDRKPAPAAPVRAEPAVLDGETTFVSQPVVQPVPATRR